MRIQIETKAKHANSIVELDAKSIRAVPRGFDEGKERLDFPYTYIVVNDKFEANVPIEGTLEISAI